MLLTTPFFAPSIAPWCSHTRMTCAAPPPRRAHWKSARRAHQGILATACHTMHPQLGHPGGHNERPLVAAQLRWLRVGALFPAGCGTFSPGTAAAGSSGFPPPSITRAHCVCNPPSILYVLPARGRSLLATSGVCVCVPLGPQPSVVHHRYVLPRPLPFEHVTNGGGCEMVCPMAMGYVCRTG